MGFILLYHIVLYLLNKVAIRFHQIKIVRYLGVRVHRKLNQSSILSFQVKLLVESYLDLSLACGVNLYMVYVKK